MSIAGVYVQISEGKERYKSVDRILKRPTDGQLVRLPCHQRLLCLEMASKTSSKSESLAKRVKNFFNATFGDEDVQPQQQPPPPEPEVTSKLAAYTVKVYDYRRATCCGIPCGLPCSILYVVLSALTVLKAVGLIMVGIITAVAVQFYSTEQASKATALVIVLVAALGTVALTIWSVVAFFRKEGKVMKKLAVFLFLLGLFQLILTLVAVVPGPKDQQRFLQELEVSFHNANQNVPKYVSQWRATQFNLHCCGFQSPEDYRRPNFPPLFAPNVPVSCCPAYLPNVPDGAQEAARERCKQNNEYYSRGCADSIVTYFKEVSVVVTSLVTGLFFLQFFLALYACCCGCLRKPKSYSVDDPEVTSAQVTTSA